MTTDQEKILQKLLENSSKSLELLETLVIVNAASAGIPSTKIRAILRIDQTKVSNISKHVKSSVKDESEDKKARSKKTKG